jgi:hypothetical protein
MFENREASGRTGKWAAQLAEHTINFTSQSAIKSQVLADFIADSTPSSPVQEQPTTEVIWHMACDGAYCEKDAGASVVLVPPSGVKLKYAIRLDFDGCTNNVAEYEGLLLGLWKARALGVWRLSIKFDLELITRHVDQSYRAHHLS